MNTQLRAVAGVKGGNQLTPRHPITRGDECFHWLHADQEPLRCSQCQHPSPGDIAAEADDTTGRGNDVLSTCCQVKASVAWPPRRAGGAKISEYSLLTLGGPRPHCGGHGRQKKEQHEGEQSVNHGGSVPEGECGRGVSEFSRAVSGWNQQPGQLR